MGTSTMVGRLLVWTALVCACAAAETAAVSDVLSRAMPKPDGAKKGVTQPLRPLHRTVISSSAADQADNAALLQTVERDPVEHGGRNYFAAAKDTARAIRELMLQHEKSVADVNAKFADKLVEKKRDMATRLGRPYPENGLLGALFAPKSKVLPPFTAGINELGLGVADENLNDVLPKPPSAALPERAFVYGPAVSSTKITGNMIEKSGAERLKDHIVQEDRRRR